MEKKNQFYLSAFIMYLIAGFAGYINQFSNYWIVFILSLLVTAYTLTNAFFNEKDVKKTNAVEWISVCAFFVLEVVLTVCIAIIKVPYVGFFKYFNYSVQFLGLGFAIYSIVRFIISFTKIVSIIKEKLEERKTNKATKQTISEEKNEVAIRVEETIAKETTIQDATSQDTISDVDIVGESEKEPKVIGIEYKKEKEIETPYMEEEL